MKKTKQPGGVLGRNKQYVSKLKNIGLVMLVAVCVLFFGALFNDAHAGIISGVTVGAGIKCLSLGAFVPIALKGTETDAEKKEIAEKNFVGSILYKAKEEMASELALTNNQITKLNEQLAEALKAKGATPEQIEEINAIALKMKALEEKGPKSDPAVLKLIKTQLKTWCEDNKDKFEAFRKGELKNLTFELDFKAAAVMLESTNLGGSAYLPFREIVPGVMDIARNRPFIENYINSSATSSARIVWVNKVNPDGNAEMTAEGALKPLIDFEFETEESSAKKVTAVEKVSMEMLEDFDFMAQMIEQELRYQVDIKVNEQLLFGDGTGQNLKGITEYASAYNLSTINTVDANNADAIIAAKTQIETQNFMATVAFVNPIDKANMKLTKTTTGERLVSLNADEDTGVTVVSDNGIPVGYVLVVDPSKYIKRDLKPLTISYGWENDDFRKNLVTVLGERRLHAYASNNNVGAFLYDTFDNIKTALTLP